MQRRLDLAGCLNFRDLGGYPTADGRMVRWRQVFRSDALHLLTPTDVARLRDDVGLGCVVDLRSTAELTSEGRGLLDAERMRFHHLPLFDGEIREGREKAMQLDLTDRYVLMAQFATGPIGRVLTTLAESDAPSVFHCAAGKDRTGVISAIILGLLGVEDDVIVADYAATQENLDAITERLMSLEGYRTMLAALPPETMHANPETMAAFLRRMRERWGGMEGYAAEAGVSDASLARLRERLIGPLSE
jgi:protein tyrosine/serine phosphatase